MENDAFISYSHLDAEWAEKLRADLERKNFTVFLDTTRLEAGTDWEESLLRKLNESRHLILLWSQKNAAVSQWVEKEAVAFQVMIFQDQWKGLPNNRRLLQVCLDGRNGDYSRWQAINDLDDNQQFMAGADNVNPNKWQTVLDKLETAMRFDDTAPEIYLVILASTRMAMQALPINAAPFDAKPLGALLNELGITHPQLMSTYGEERSDWRPFQSEKNILTIVSQLRAELIAACGPTFRWKPVGNDFWTGEPNNLTIKRIAKQLAKEPCVIVIDALSLYDPQVLGRYQSLSDSLYNKYACIMVLPPFTHAQQNLLGATMAQIAQEMYNRFYDPDFDETRVLQASCNVLTLDEQEARRLVTATLRRSKQDLKQWWATL